MKIGELARRFSVRTSTLRYYERRGLLTKPARVAGRRFYDDEAVRRINFVLAAKESGLTLHEIQVMIEAGEAGTDLGFLWRSLAREKLVLVNKKIAALRASQAALREKLECRCRSLAQCERMLSEKR